MSAVLLTGSTGFIGSHYKELSAENLLCPTHRELDLTDIHSVREYLHVYRPKKIIHCASNDGDICLYDNLRMFNNLAESEIPMVTFCTGREVEDRSYKNGEYVLSKKIIKELALSKYHHIAIVQLWGCFGANEKLIRFFRANMDNIANGRSICVDADRMFSYVYVKDVVRIVQRIDPLDARKLYRLVAYTAFFSHYADILGNCLSNKGFYVDSERFSSSYVGLNNYEYRYTPIGEAIKDMWEEIHEKQGRDRN